MNAISDIRKKYRLSQQQLAAWLGTSRTTVAMAETGQRDLPIEALKKFNRLAIAYETAQSAPAAANTEGAPAIKQRLAFRKRLKKRQQQLNRQARRLSYILSGLQALNNDIQNQAAGIRKLQLTQSQQDITAGRQNLLVNLQDDTNQLLTAQAQKQFILQSKLLSLQFEAALLQLQLQTANGIGNKLSQYNILAIVQELLGG